MNAGATMKIFQIPILGVKHKIKLAILIGKIQYPKTDTLQKNDNSHFSSLAFNVIITA